MNQRDTEGTTELVYVVDDDASVRESLCWLLSTESIPSQSFDRAASLLAAWQDSWAGCILADVRMPGMDGLELLEALQQRESTLPVVMLTGHADVAMAIRAMKLGAFDFLEKPYRDKDLLGIVGKALAYHRDTLRESLILRGRRKAMEQLTPRERQVLTMIVDGLTNRGIAQRLGISEKTVEAHRARVMKKSGAGSLPELIRIWVAVAQSREA